MREHTNVQILNNEKGIPTHAIVIYPYKEFIKTDVYKKSKIKNDLDLAIPLKVSELVVINDYTPLKAWREYLGLTQKELANKLSISQPTYLEYEQKEKLTKKARIKLAKALGIRQEQLDC